MGKQYANYILKFFLKKELDFSVYHYASLDFLCAAHNGFCF